MKKTNPELIVGISIFFSLFVLIAGVMWLKEINVSRKLVDYTVLFENVGVLQSGDPVAVNGVKRGSAAKIYFLDDKVAVDIRVDRDIQLTDSAVVKVENIGLMGERQIGIRLSSKGSVVPPNNEEKKTYLIGKFDSGIAEAMGLLGEVLTDVKGLLGSAKGIIQETVGDTGFGEFFGNLVSRLDTVTYLMEDLLVKGKPDLERTIDNVHAATNDLRRLLDSQDDNFEAIVENSKDLTERALVVADRVDSIAATVNGMLADIENGEGAIGMMMKDEQFYEDVKGTVADLDTLVNDINDNGLKLRIKLGFGKKKRD